MKVLFITRESDRPETHLIMGLHDAGFDALILGDLLPALEARVRSKGIPYERLTIQSRTDREAIRRIRSVVRAWSPDVVQCFTSRALTCAIAAGLPKRTRLMGYRGAMGRLSHLDPANLFGVFHVRVNGILCLSDSIVTALNRRGVPLHKLFKIHKGHDPRWYAESDRESTPHDPSVFVVGFIGNMRRVKGAHVLLEALCSMNPSVGIRLVLVGEVIDPKVKALLNKPEIATRVESRGYVPDASALIRGFDALAVPSLEGEGLSKAAIEAMMQHVPVVASASGGLVELIEDRVSGRLVPPGNAQALAQALEELARDRETRLRYAESAYTRVTSLYHVDRTVSEVAEIYRGLCETA